MPKHFRNIVAFDRRFQENPENVHQPNECISVKTLMESLKLTGAAMWELADRTTNKKCIFRILIHFCAQSALTLSLRFKDVLDEFAESVSIFCDMSKATASGVNKV